MPSDAGEAYTPREQHTTTDAVAIIAQSVAAIHARPQDDHSLTSMSTQGFYSAYHFHRLFIKHTGTTPARFVTAVRMQRAKRLIVFTDLPIMDIAASVGYASIGTFTTQFGALVGVSPSIYRKFIDIAGDRRLGDLYRQPSGGFERSIACPSPWTNPITIAGSFSSGIPQGIPGNYCVTHEPAVSLMRRAGTLFVSSFAAEHTVLDLEAHGNAAPMVAAVSVNHQLEWPGAPLKLRALHPTDPPIITSLPMVKLMEDAEKVPQSTIFLPPVRSSSKLRARH